MNDEDSYYVDIPCPFKFNCAIEHQKLKPRAEIKEIQERQGPTGVGKRLLMGATRAQYYLYLAPVGCFGGKAAAQLQGQVIVTTNPRKWDDGTPFVSVDDNFLNNVPHITLEEWEQYYEAKQRMKELAKENPQRWSSKEVDQDSEQESSDSSKDSEE